MQRLQPNFMTDGIRNFIAQRKQLIVTDRKNILNYHFQPIQRLQPKSMINSIRKFMYIKHSGDNTKLRIFSFIPQRQHIQPNFMTDSIRTFIHNEQQTQPEQPKQRNQRGFH